MLRRVTLFWLQATIHILLAQRQLLFLWRRFAIAGTLRAGRARGDVHLPRPKVFALFAASDDTPRLAIAGTLRALLVALFGL